jgi:hypothetical protein
MIEYVSTIRFSLNFEDHKNSVQVLAGDSVFFDGSQATFTKKDGSEIAGRAPSLRSAINMKWLSPKTNGKVPAVQAKEASKTVDRDADRVPFNRGAKYDNLKGGSFEEMLAKDRSEDKVIKESDLIVKETKPFAVAEKKAAAAGEKLEVSGDQVEVRDNVMVNSSTTVVPGRTHKRAVIRSEDYGAESTTALKFKGTGTKEEGKKAQTFTVDSSTPNIPEEATMAEVKRVVAVVKNDGEAQDARVIKTVKRASMSVDSVEGITLKNTGKPTSRIVEKEGVTFRAPERAGQSEAGVTVSSGGTAISEIGPGVDGVTVVQKRAGVNIPAQTPESTDYLSMLPEDWGNLHWTKKEKFIKILTDVGFLKFILSVETINAVQDACQARLDELDQKTAD